MFKRLFISVLLIITMTFTASEAFAFWIWTPSTNKWVNPKYAVKDTPAGQLEYAMEYFDKGDFDRAVKEFRRLVEAYPKAKEAAEAQYFVGRAYEELNRPYDAFLAYQIVVEKYPYSERSPEIIDRQYDIGNLFLDGKVKRSKFVTTVIGSAYDVVDIFRTVIQNAPYGQHAASAQYKIGLYLMEKGMYQESRDEFEKVINDYPESEWAKAAKYQTALADASRSADAPYDQQITQSAIQEFHEFVENNPDAELSAEAREKIVNLRSKEAENNFIIARFYEKQEKYRSARIYYNTVVEKFPQTSWAVKALEKVREMDYILND